jgi:hypothetical protein
MNEMLGEEPQKELFEQHGQTPTHMGPMQKQ